jgi:hypothetical protein
MPKRIALMACAGAWLILAVAASSFAADENSSNSAVGNWILNPTKSHFQNMPAPKLERLRILKDDQKAFSWTMSGFDVDGKAFHELYDGPIDGSFHSIVGAANDANVAYTRSNSGISWVIKDKSGAIVETGSAKVSPDGRTLTRTGTLKTPQGEANFTSVYDRFK